MSIFEAGMLICFGVSWPIAAYKTYKSKSVNGKSLRFSCLILLGYFLGITHKILYSQDWVLFLYYICGPYLYSCFVWERLVEMII